MPNFRFAPMRLALPVGVWLVAACSGGYSSGCNGDIDGSPTVNLLFEILPAIGFVGAPVQLDNGAPGVLFGLAAGVDGKGNQLVYFNDDNDNTVKLLSK